MSQSFHWRNVFDNVACDMKTGFKAVKRPTMSFTANFVPRAKSNNQETLVTIPLKLMGQTYDALQTARSEFLFSIVR